MKDNYIKVHGAGFDTEFFTFNSLDLSDARSADEASRLLVLERQSMLKSKEGRIDIKRSIYKQTPIVSWLPEIGVSTNLRSFN